MKERQQVAVGGAIFNNNDEILMVQRIKDDEFMPGAWELPGGGTDFGETPVDGLKREVMEECGIQISVGKPVAVTDYYIERNGERVQRVEIIFLCQLLSDPESVVLSDEHESFRWLALENIVELEMTEFMKSIISEVRDSNLKS